MNCPTDKQIGAVRVSASQNGYPYWTRIDGDRVNWTLGHEEARDLHYALGRIVAWLDHVERKK